MRRWVKGLIAGVATGLCGAGFGLSPLGADFERRVGLPWLFKVRGEIEAPPEVVVVAIDQRTGGHLGLPVMPREWPRSIHARLIESLVERGASVVVFDLDLHLQKSPEEDLAFARAIADSERVVLFERLDGQQRPIVDSGGRQIGMTWVEHVIQPIPPLAEAAKGLGPFPLPKVQIAVDRFWAFKHSAGDVPTMPAVALQVHALGSYDSWRELLQRVKAPGVEDLPRRQEEVTRATEIRNLMGTLRSAFESDPGLAGRVTEIVGRDDAFNIGPAEQKLFAALAGLYGGDEHRFLNFYGPPGSITTVPYHSLITGNDLDVEPDGLDLTGKIVFVGFSDLYDPGQPERFYTVFTRSDGVDLSGVEIAATAFGNLLTDRSLRQGRRLVTASILVAFGGILGAVIYVLPALVAVPSGFVLAALYGVAVQYEFNAADGWLPLATPILLQFPMALFIGLLGQYLLERHQKREFSQAIELYIPVSVAKGLTEKGLDPSSLNTVVYGTCFATDMAGFTTIAEKMKPKRLASFMNSYFEALAEPLKRHDVDVMEFHADTIMCAWTAAQPNAVVRNKAVLAALDVAEAIDRFTDQHTPFRLWARIGLDAGRFYVGHTGGGGRFTYSILGDPANTAARIEALNNQVGTHVLATQTVVETLDNLLLRPLGLFQLVGKSNPTPVVEVLARAASASASQLGLCERFAAALDMFAAGRWARAATLFRAILRDHPDDGPTRFYFDRARRYQIKPPRTEHPSVIPMDAK